MEASAPCLNLRCPGSQTGWPFSVLSDTTPSIPGAGSLAQGRVELLVMRLLCKETMLEAPSALQMVQIPTDSVQSAFLHGDAVSLGFS